VSRDSESDRAAGGSGTLLGGNDGLTNRLSRIHLKIAATGATIRGDYVLLLFGNLCAPPKRWLWLASNPSRQSDNPADLAWDKSLFHRCAASEARRFCIHGKWVLPPTRDANRDSGTDRATGGWLRREPV
jgi:hypothetical protein